MVDYSGERPRRQGDLWGAGWIAIIYAVVSWTWILSSDQLLQALIPTDTALYRALQTYKGLIFVTATSLLLWVLIARRFHVIFASESERNRLEDVLATFGDNMPGIAYVKDEQGRYLFMRGHMPDPLPRPGTLVGKTVRDVVDAETAARLEATDLDVLRSGKSLQTLETITVSGQTIHYLSNRFVLIGPDGTRRLGAVAFDVTERTNAEAKIRELARDLEDANRQKDLFLSNLSHELRTPITAIRLWIEVLKRARDPSDFESVRDAALMIENSAVVQGQLIDDLLDVTRIITGKLRIEQKPLSLKDSIRATVGLLEPVADEKGVSVSLDLPDASAAIIGDARRVQQIVWNLLTNAIKFSNVQGRVGIALTRDGSDWALKVRDEGIGIAPDVLPRLFERFRAADNQRVRPEGGLGLGLSLVKHMVEAHGGTIVAESAGAGRGATFTVRLPASDPANIAKPETPPSRTQRLESCRILLVEDNADSRTGLALLLGRAGAKVTAVDDVKTALAAGDGFDVLLSDIGLPDRDGCELVAELRRRQAWAGVAAIAISAYALPEDRARAAGAGFNSFVTKPIDPEGLIAHIVALRQYHSPKPAEA